MFSNAVNHQCVSPAVLRFVPSLLDTTNHLHLVHCWVVLLLFNVKYDPFMKHSRLCYLLFLEYVRDWS